MRIFLFMVGCAGVVACWGFLPDLPARLSGADKQPLHSYVAVSACLLNIWTSTSPERNRTDLAGIKLRAGSAEVEPSGPVDPSSERTVGSVCHHVEYAEPVMASGVYLELAEHLSSDAPYSVVADVMLRVYRVHGAVDGDALSAFGGHMLDKGLDSLLASSRQQEFGRIVRVDKLRVVMQESTTGLVETGTAKGRLLVDVKRGWDGVDRVELNLNYVVGNVFNTRSPRQMATLIIWLCIMVILWTAFFLSLMARIHLTKIAICAGVFAGGLAWGVDVVFTLPYLVTGNDWDALHAAVELGFRNPFCVTFCDDTPQGSAGSGQVRLDMWVVVLVRFAQFAAHFVLLHSLWSERMILASIVVNFFLASVYESFVSILILKSSVEFVLLHLPMPLLGVIFPLLVWAMQRRTRAAITNMVQVRKTTLHHP